MTKLIIAQLADSVPAVSCLVDTVDKIDGKVFI